MIQIDLDPIPNQSFSLVVDQSRYEVTIRLAVEVMIADILRDGEEVVLGVRCLPDTLIIPYQYLEGSKGNFVFLTEGDEIPNYTLFGVTQNLYYLSPTELAELRDANA